MRRTDGFAPIEAYGVISDQRTAALVAADGAIDWMCAPRFDDPPLFGALLDPARGGVFALAPAEGGTAERCYVEDTNVLETTWTTPGGVVRVSDALAVTHGIQRFSQLVRRVECLAGAVRVRWRMRPRPGWDAAAPGLRAVGNGHALRCGEMELLFQAFDAGAVEVADAELRGEVELAAGEAAVLSLMLNHDFPLLATTRETCERRLQGTIAFWRSWLAPLRYEGPWEAAVRRSALALSACVHDQTGALVAAPTTSLPERLGGSRNYDYRYCWVRDTSFALDAALRLGLDQLAHATLGWLLRSQQRTHPRLNVFFTLGGDAYRPQREADLAGYRGSRPVRVGNDAGGQLQLDCYGELMQTAWLFVREGNHLHEHAGLRLAEVADHLCEIWRRPDAGIWELSDRRHYTQSKLSCWAALEWAARLAEAGELRRAHVARWRVTQTEIDAWVRGHCLAPDGTLLRDGDGSGELDCAVLLAARSPYLRGGEQLMLRTVKRLRAELGAGGPLLYRFSGMAEEENAFLPCSFWLAEALARGGRLDEAAALMDELTGIGNDLGLLSEEVDPVDGSLVGNFPQALSHLALLNAAAVHAAQDAGAPAEAGTAD